MKKEETYKGSIWKLKERVTEQVFNNLDFTNTNFNSSIFENIKFSECLFDKSNLAGSKLFYESSFYKCDFINVDLSNSTFGSHKGTYNGCTFDKCNFRGKEFNFTQFIDCIFKECKLKKINFNGSSFANCKFIGAQDNVTFNGIYDTNKGIHPVLNKVDFSAAKFGEFVTFIDCDLNNCIPPNNKLFDELLYNLYSNDPRILSTGSKDRIILTRK